jgi:surface antigen
MLGTAQRLGYQTSPPDRPVVGSMVVYAPGWGGPGDTPGHIATVIGVQGDRFEVIEQNLVNSSSVLAGNWGTFDVRIDQAGARGIEGFIVAPR